MKVKFTTSVSCELIDEVVGGIPESYYSCDLVLNTELDFLPQIGQHFSTSGTSLIAKSVTYNLSENCAKVLLAPFSRINEIRGWFNSSDDPVEEAPEYLQYKKLISDYQQQRWEIEKE